MLVPGNPTFQRERIPWKPTPSLTEPLFAYGRHSIRAFFEFANQKRDGGAARIWVPDYLCREVTQDFRAFGLSVLFYPLMPATLQADPAAIASLAKTGDFVLVCHLYGKRVAESRLSQIAQLCERAGAWLIEDCAHLPFSGASPVIEPHARWYSFRKTYPVPHGSLLLTRKESADAFAKYVDSQRAGRVELSAFWESRDRVKRWLIRSGPVGQLLYARQSRGIERAYHEIDLPESSRCDEKVEAILRKLDWETAAQRVTERRRANARRFLEELGSLDGSELKLMPFDSPGDVPYQLLTEVIHRSRETLIDFCRERGVVLFPGTNLDPEIEKGLPANHPYRRFVGIPVHQDLSERQVLHAASTLRAFFERGRLQ